MNEMMTETELDNLKRLHRQADALLAEVTKTDPTQADFRARIAEQTADFACVACDLARVLNEKTTERLPEPSHTTVEGWLADATWVQFVGRELRAMTAERLATFPSWFETMSRLIEAELARRQERA